MLSRDEIADRIKCVTDIMNDDEPYSVRNSDGKVRSAPITRHMMLGWCNNIKDGSWHSLSGRKNIQTVMNYANQIWERLKNA
jgi:hypothetical protein